MSRLMWTLAFAALPFITFAGNPEATFPDRVSVSYCIYDIGGGVDTEGEEIYVTAEDINNLGQVIGSTNVSGNTQAYVWHRRSGTRLLGVLPGQTHSNGAAINDAGVAVGNSFNADTGTQLSFVWDVRHGLRVLDASIGAGRHSATGLNRFGQVTGASDLTAGATHAIRRNRNGEVLDLGTLPGGDYSYGTAINDRGTVVGISSTDAIRNTEGFVWTPTGGMQFLKLDELGEYPRAINNRGEVVGTVEGELIRAFLWTAAGGRVDLGALSGVDTDSAEAHDINEWGTVVGASLTTSRQSHAFIWRRSHGMKDLNPMLDSTSSLAPHVVVQVAKAINEFGWIVAEGNDLRRLGGSHAFLLVPRWYTGMPPCD